MRDRAGIAMVRHSGWKQVIKEGITQHLPTFDCILSLSIQPSGTHELEIGELRAWVVQLATFWGFKVRAVTYDGFQSRESIQILRKTGIKSYEVSMDRDLDPYDYLRRAFYEDRIDMLNHDLLRVELVELDHNENTKKIDHPPKGSKDVADALAGAVFAASTSRTIRRGPEFQKDGLRVRVLGSEGRTTPLAIVDPKTGRKVNGDMEPEPNAPRRTDPYGNPM